MKQLKLDLPELFDRRERLIDEEIIETSKGRVFVIETWVEEKFTCEDEFGLISAYDWSKESVDNNGIPINADGTLNLRFSGSGINIGSVNYYDLPDFSPEKRLQKCIDEGQSPSWHELTRYESDPFPYSPTV